MFEVIMWFLGMVIATGIFFIWEYYYMRDRQCFT